MAPPCLPRLEVPGWAFDALTLGIFDKSVAVDAYVRQCIDRYYEASEGVYTVKYTAGTPPVTYDVQVRVMPFFRRAQGYAPRPGTPGELLDRVLDVTGRHRDKDFRESVRMCVYGRGSPEDLRVATQALIDEGKLDEVRRKYEHPNMSEAEFRATHGNVSNNPLSPQDEIKLLQWEYGLGIDCAGYVQQAFLAVHGGSRKSWGLHDRIGWERLDDLKGNKAFTRALTPVNARPGDLLILDPPAGDDRGHTVLIRDRQVLTAEESRKLTGLDRFATPTDTVHRIEVDASWGAQKGNLDNGGVQRRTFLYNETTGGWADVDARTGAVTQDPKKAGPYHGHPVEGIYHPKR